MSTSFFPYDGVSRRLSRFGFGLTALLAMGVSVLNVGAQEPALQDDGVEMKLPGNPINDVLNFYEMLTGKRMIRDANLAGPNLTVVVPNRIPKAEAVAMLESAMLLNGYTLVNVDENTVKILGPAKPPLGEGIPLFVTPESLPRQEMVASYFMVFRYISPKDAMEVFAGYVTPRANGKMVVVPNSNAMVITDNTPLIRRLIDLQAVIDVPSTRVLTEFVPLTRASADKVAELINKILEEEKQKRDAGHAAVDAPANVPPPPGGAPVAAAPGASLSVSTTGTQVLADVRTNRIVIVAAESRMPYLIKLVQDLDAAVDLDPPLTWPLKFVSAGEVLPVLQSIIAEGEDADKATSPQTGANGSTTTTSSQNDYSSSDSYSSSSSSGGGASRPDKLKAPTAETSPIAISIGKTRIIADRSANKIIVIGPPESKSKAADVLALLDQKPKQIYLATVIGELTLGKGLDLGVQYPGSTKVSLNVTGNNGNISGSVSNGASTGNTLINSNGGVDIVPGTAEAINSAFQIASGVGLPILSGLSLYGVVGDSIDLYLKALQSTNNFRVISRPVVYTANNKKAVISSGQEVPVPESQLTSSSNSSVTGADVATTIGYKDVVLKLEVVPLINSNHEVTLQIAQQNNNIRGNTTIGNNTVPVVGTQELTTTVTVPNRHTVVLGGLITEEETITRTGLPFLSSLPVIGYAFGQKSKSTTRRELIIMIQPFIISNAEDEAEVNYIETSMSGLNGQLYQDKIPVRRAEPVALPVQTPPTGWRKAKNDLSPMGDN